MAFVKRFPTYIKLTNIKETFLESHNWSFKRKEIEYNVNRPKSIFEYHGCYINKSMWLDIKPKLEEQGAALLDIQINEVQSFDHYIRAYSDGSNDLQGQASYGFVFLESDNKDNINTITEGGDLIPVGTNSVGELSGAIRCLTEIYNYLKDNDIKNCLIELCSDSNYVILGHTLHMPKQIERGWKNTNNQPTPNREYWETLIDIVEKIESLSDDIHLVFKWVKGHKLKAKDTKVIKEEEFLDSIRNNDLRKQEISNYEELGLGVGHLDTLMNERCDILAKRSIGIKI